MPTTLLESLDMIFGDWLLLKRRELGLGQEEVCQAIGVNRNTISNWERKVTLPSITEVQLKKLANLLKVEEPEIPLKAITRYEPEDDK
jgi:transcriptional regulator with XRE-family HTH domain